jgi:hypothetical protein
VLWFCPACWSPDMALSISTNHMYFTFRLQTLTLHSVCYQWWQRKVWQCEWIGKQTASLNPNYMSSHLFLGPSTAGHVIPALKIKHTMKSWG